MSTMDTIACWFGVALLVLLGQLTGLYSLHGLISEANGFLAQVHHASGLPSGQGAIAAIGRGFGSLCDATSSAVMDSVQGLLGS